MHGTLRAEVAGAIKIDGTSMHGAARTCSSPFGRACKAIWPVKTAEELAMRTGSAVRTAAYELAGDREPSARSIAALVVEVARWTGKSTSRNAATE